MKVPARTNTRHTASPAVPVRRLPVWAQAADALTIALLVLAVGIAVYGGGAWQIAGIRWSMRSSWRLPIWAAGLTILRHLFARQLPLHRRVIEAVTAVIRRPEPRYPDVVLAGTSTTIVTPFLRRSRIVQWAAAVILLYAALTFAMTYPQSRSSTAGSARTSAIRYFRPGGWRGSPTSCRAIRCTCSTPTSSIPRDTRWRSPTRCWCRR